MANSEKILTPVCRLSYPWLDKPQVKRNKAGQVTGEDYGCALLIPKDLKAAYARLGLAPTLVEQSITRLEEMKKAAALRAIDYFGSKDKVPLGIRNQDLSKLSGWPFQDGARKETEGYGPDVLFINVSSKYKPLMVNRRREVIANVRDELYAGCWVVAQLSTYGYNTDGNKGVSFGLLGLQKVCDDDKLGGASADADAFDSFDDGDAGNDSSGLFD